MNSVVAVYATHPQSDEALRAFQSTGFDMKKLSIVGKDYHTEGHGIGFYNAGDRVKFWGKRRSRPTSSSSSPTGPSMMCPPRSASSSARSPCR